MAATRRLTQLVESAQSRLKLPTGPLVVALSGGADSAALAYLCVESGREARAVHVNHSLAHSAELETAAVAIATRLDLELEVRTVTLPESGASLEGRARTARYAAFGETTTMEERLLTAHTLEDNAETVLINLVRGAGARGLSGIPYHRFPNVYRPALEISRSETREIAALARLGFVDDPMNQDPTLTRNLIRQQVIPFLEGFNSRLLPALARTAASLARDVAHLEAEAARVGVDYRDEVATCPLGALAAAPRAIADRVLMDMLAHVSRGEGVTAGHVERMRSVVEGRAESQEMGWGVSVWRKGPLVVVGVPKSTNGRGQGVELTAGSHHAGGLELFVMARDAVCQVMPLSKWAAVFPPNIRLEADTDGTVLADGEPAWIPGVRRFPVAWYQPGTVGYLFVSARGRI